MNESPEQHGATGHGVETRSPVVAVIASTVVHVVIALALVMMGVTAATATARAMSAPREGRPTVRSASAAYAGNSSP